MTNRRSFLRRSAAAIGFPTIVPASVFGQNAPSNRITLGVVGWGMQGPPNTRAFLAEEDCRVIAACDLDQQHLAAATDTINGWYKNQDCAAYRDFREMLARPDIDAVMLAVPDHWHGVLSVAAAKAGKDIYGEKPLARTIAEQQAIVRAVEKHGRIWQTGSWQRSQDHFRRAAEIVRNGLIGRLTHVEVGLPGGHNDLARTGDKTQITEPPAHLDYDTWIGPAEMQPYIEARVHKNWRWNYNTGGGQLLDWIGHHCDIAHWGMGMDNGGPTTVKFVQVDMPPRADIWNTATRYRTECTYADGVVMTIAGGHNDILSGTKWIGTEGWVHVTRNEVFDSSNPDFKKAVKRRIRDKVVDGFVVAKLGDDLIKQRLYESPGHQRNFLDSIKSRQPTITPVQTAHHSAIPGHLSLIAMTLGRDIAWDPTTETIPGNDTAATALLARNLRGDWSLES